MRGRQSLLSDPMPQVGRATVGYGIRAHTLARTVTIPPMQEGDIELVMSTVEEVGNIEPTWLIPAGDDILAISQDTGAVSYVVRHGDAFTLQFVEVDSDPLVPYSPWEIYWEANPQYNPTTHRFVALDDDRIVGWIPKRYSYPQTGGRDDFVVLHVNHDTKIGYYDPRKQRALTTWSYEFGNTGLEKMVRLDATHVAVAAVTSDVAGRRPYMWMLEIDGDDTLHKYGPFTYGALSQEGGARATGMMNLFPMSGNKILAVWTDQVEPDFTGTTNLYHRSVVHAQVLTYDTGAHTVTASGPLRRFDGGVNFDEYYDTKFHWYPERELLVIIAVNYTALYDYGDDSDYFQGYDYNISARTIVASGLDVVEKRGPLRIATPKPDGGEDYFYSFTSLRVGDRIAVIWPYVNDDGGEIRYTKVQVGIDGASVGGLKIYDEGILIPDSADWETFGYHEVDLPTGETLGLFEHYRQVDVPLRFVLAKEGIFP